MISIFISAVVGLKASRIKRYRTHIGCRCGPTKSPGGSSGLSGERSRGILFNVVPTASGACASKSCSVCKCSRDRVCRRQGRKLKSPCRPRSIGSDMLYLNRIGLTRRIRCRRDYIKCSCLSVRRMTLCAGRFARGSGHAWWRAASKVRPIIVCAANNRWRTST